MVKRSREASSSGPGPDRRSAGSRGRDRRTLERRFPAPHPPRDLIKARSGEYSARRRSIPHRHSCRATAESACVRAARRALAGEALSVYRTRRRRPRRARARARRLFADAGVSRDCGSAHATRRTRGNRRGEDRRRGAPESVRREPAYSPMISPNGIHRLPSNFSSCNCLMPR
jgi:hypothetical protein